MRYMKKRIKKYLSGSMAVVLLSISVPLQITAEPDIENDSDVVGMEKEISPDTDKISEDMMKEPTDTDQTMVDAQDNSNVSDWIPAQDTVSPSETGMDDIPDYQEKIDIVNGSEEMNVNARIDDNSDSEDVTATFIDPEFRSVVKKILNLGEEEPITKSACANIESLNIPGKNIKNLNGIEYFKNIKRLDCSRNNLTSLSVSGFTNLQSLDCSGNHITDLDVGDCQNLKGLCCGKGSYYEEEDDKEYEGIFGNPLTDLDLSGCPNLQRLTCSNTQLENLDVRACSKLEYLDASNCVNLQSLDCKRSGLKELYVNGCINLRSLDSSNNILETFNLTGCTNLETLILICSDRKGDLKIDFNEFINLRDLKYGMYNEGSIIDGELNISGCKSIESLECWQINRVDVSGCTSLQSLKCFNCDMETLNLRDCSNLQTLDIDPTAGFFVENHPHRIDTLDVSGLSNLQTLNCEHVDNINAGGCSSLKSLTCHYISNLDIKGCDSLESLDCSHGELEKLDIRNLPNLQSLKYNGSCSQTLDASGCTKLQYLECHADTDFYSIPHGDLKSLDVSNCTNLQVLDCNSNNLENLNMKGCTNLQSLNCKGNELEALDVSDCINLQYLDCEVNHLKNLDIKGNISLQSLDCMFNGLENLNISGCTNLRSLVCYGGQCEGGSLGGGMIEVYTGIIKRSERSKLKNLNIKGCTNLQSLTCPNNDLKSLDLSGCDNLISVNCIHNIMKSPDDVKNRPQKLDGGEFIFYPQRGESNVTITPTVTPIPTQNPTAEPTTVPTQTPTAGPTTVPTQTPTAKPTTVPTIRPTVQPTLEPTTQPTTGKKEQKMSVDRKSLTLYAGGKATTLKVSNAKGKITFKSSDPRIVKVSKKGKVSPKSIGKATITIKSTGNNIYKTATLKIAVTVKSNFKKSRWIAYTNGGFYFKIHKVTGKKMGFSFHMPNMDLKNKTASIKADGKTATAKIKCPDGKVHALKIVISKNAIKVQETSSCTKKLLGSSIPGRKKTISHKFRPDEYPWNASSSWD